MANTTISNQRVIHKFIVPYDTVKCDKFTHITLELPDTLQEFRKQEIQIIRGLIEDKEITDIGKELGFGYPKEQARQVLKVLRAKFNCNTAHGLIAKLYQMGFHFEPLSKGEETPQK